MSSPAVNLIYLDLAGKKPSCSFCSFPTFLLILVISQAVPRAGEWVLLQLPPGVFLHHPLKMAVLGRVRDRILVCSDLIH